jgi:hypothetical protein
MRFANDSQPPQLIQRYTLLCRQHPLSLLGDYFCKHIHHAFYPPKSALPARRLD